MPGRSRKQDAQADRVIGSRRYPGRSGCPDGRDRWLPGTFVLSDFIGHFLTFRQGAEPRSLQRGDVNENIVAAFIGRDKAIALLDVEEFYSASFHGGSFDCTWLARYAPANLDRPGDCERALEGNEQSAAGPALIDSSP